MKSHIFTDVCFVLILFDIHIPPVDHHICCSGSYHDSAT